MVHNFDDSLIIGKLGEEKFLMECGEVFEKRNGRIEDFRVKSTGTLVELKTDQYCPENPFIEIGYTPPKVLPNGSKAWTKNFVIERYSNERVKNNGGPWQSLEKEIPIFIYQFLYSSFRIIFNTKELIKGVEKYVTDKNISLMNIVNKSHITQIYLIPIRYLIDLHRIVIIG